MGCRPSLLFQLTTINDQRSTISHQQSTAPPVGLTIAGSDSSAGAGIQADLRTCALLGVHALVAVTAVTVQNSLGVKGFHEIPLDVIAGLERSVREVPGLEVKFSQPMKR